ncbi:DUF5719 family protein [Propionibacteriaceae bacterium Y2011]
MSTPTVKQRILLPVIAIVATALVVAVGTLVPVEAQPPPVAGDTVDPRTTRLCPVDGDDERSLQLAAAGVGDGSLAVTQLGRRDVVAELTAEGVVREDVPAAAYAVVGERAMATTAAATLATRTADGVDRGLAAQACAQPATEHWFAGLGASGGQFSALVVANPDTQAAEVEVRFRGPEGPIAAPGSSGLSIPPQGTRTIFLEGLVDGEAPIAAQVRTTAGRVSVVAVDRHRAGTEPAGIDWVAPTVAPATDLVIPGVPGGPGGREIVLVNPGERSATATVEALGAGGPFIPEGGDRIDVPAGRTVRLALADALGGEATGLRVTSTVPVTGAVLATSEAGGMAVDRTTAVATTPINQQSVVALPAVSDTTGELVVSNAGDAEATVTVVVRGADGAELVSEDVVLPAGGTRAVPMDPAGAWAQLTTSGTRVHAAVPLASTADQVAGLAWLGLGGTPVAAQVPPAEHEPMILF